MSQCKSELLPNFYEEKTESIPPIASQDLILELLPCLTKNKQKPKRKHREKVLNQAQVKTTHASNVTWSLPHNH